MKNITSAFETFLWGLLYVAIGIAILTYPIMLLWNALIPQLFNGPHLTFWQTLGLYLLVRAFINSPFINQKSAE